MERVPLIVGVGGTSTPRSSTDAALQLALRAAVSAGARTMMFGGSELLRLPHYAYGEQAEEVRRFITAIRDADGVILASPGYHGSISGLVKNAIDHLQETARDDRPYLDGLPVGLIVTAHGWQATGSTLATLRAIVHALRGWPTPLGAAINVSGGVFRDGVCIDDAVARQLDVIGRQVVDFVRAKRNYPFLDAVSLMAAE